jgi:hypothetical protein
MMAGSMGKKKKINIKISRKKQENRRAKREQEFGARSS